MPTEGILEALVVVGQTGATGPQPLFVLLAANGSKGAHVDGCCTKHISALRADC